MEADIALFATVGVPLIVIIAQMALIFARFAMGQETAVIVSVPV